MVDVNKKGQVNIPGDLNVKNNLNSINLNVDQNLQVNGDTILQNAVIKGDLTVFGNINRIGEENTDCVMKNGMLYLGDPTLENSWRISIRDGELYFEHKLNGEWLIKQSIM